MKQAHPFFMYTNCMVEEAIDMYLTIFQQNAELECCYLYSEDAPDGMEGLVECAILNIGGTRFRLMDSTGHPHSLTPSTSVYVVFDDEGELREVHKKFMDDGGAELMPLGFYPFSPLYVWLEDKYGLCWQLSLV